MHEFAAALKPGELFTRQRAIDWFQAHYPKIKPTTVTLHVAGMAVNGTTRKHHPNIRPDAGWDLFYKVGTGQYRLWDAVNDPPPSYPSLQTTGEKAPAASVDSQDEAETVDEGNGAATEFAYERDLKNYLAKNLGRLEAGLKLYQEEGFTGLEYPVGGRFIDILAVDAKSSLVVIELKVSRGYDRTIGQLLRYMAWVKANLAEGKDVRGIIIASEITDDLKLATSLISNVQTIEYELALSFRQITH
jgi:hypothetical protein